MGLSTKEFWRLFARCRLRSTAECQDLYRRFRGSQEAPSPQDRPTAEVAAKWLMAEGELTRFQAKVLLSGRAGPFVYGEYVLRERLVAGRLAGCYRAVHSASGHPVLLWFLRGRELADDEAYATVAMQSTVASGVVHPCLSRTYQLVDLGDYKFIVLEDLDGESAQETLAAAGCIVPSEACHVMWQAALAAAAMHARGFVHGDIRPRNIWLDPAGNGRLLQFPLAATWHSSLGWQTGEGISAEERRLMADYAAPELGVADYAPDALTDVYAIGCTLYELLRGRPPFATDAADVGVGIAEKMQRHATEAIQPLQPLGVSGELTKVVAFAMAKDRSIRYQNAARLAESLAYFVEPERLSHLPRPAPTEATFEASRGANDRSSQALATSAASERSHVAEQKLPPVDDSDPFSFLENAAGTASATARVRAQQKRARNRLVFALALLIALLLGGGIGYLVSNHEEESAETDRIDSVTANRFADSISDGARAEAAGNGELATVADDGKTLWAAPLAGESIAWDFLPLRAEAVLVLRPADLLGHPEGKKLLAAMGPHGSSAWGAAERTIGMPLAEVEELTIAWTGGDWTATYIVRPAKATTRDELLARWKDLSPMGEDANRYFIAAGRAYAAPSAEEGRCFVVGSAELMPELLDAGTDRAPLIRDMVKLLPTSDRRRLATLLFTRNALLGDAEPHFAAAGLGRLHAALGWLLREDVKAAAFSFHLAEHCYLEARVVGNAQTTSPHQLAAAFEERRSRLAPDIEDYISQIGLHPHSSRLLIRLGAMARFVERQLRIGVEDDQVVINCYLPAVAAHNLALASELAIAQPAQEHLATATSSTQDAAAPPARASSISDRLRQTVSLSFERETLERSIQLLSGETGVPMEILGADLQLDGITKNQSFALHEIDQPAGEILQKIMRAANPDGKLVYVIKPAPSGENVLQITTRSAAQKRGDRLPPELTATDNHRPTRP